MMKAIICLDDKNGMMFNRRRQSRDSVLISRVKELANGKRILMNSYSEPLFKESGACISVLDGFLGKAENDDFCFIENEEIPLEKCDLICIFRWNRVYPADRFFDCDLQNHGFVLRSNEDFVGSSHERITLEIYERGEER